MEWSYVGAVVVTGLVIVFVALALLILAVWLMGKIFEAIRSSSDKSASPAAQKETPAPVQTVQAETPVTAADEGEEVIAVIAAAVAAMSAESGVQLKVKRIAPVPSVGRRNSWAAAAAGENTRVF